MTTALFLWDAAPELRRYLAEGLPGIELVFDDPSAAARAQVIVGWRPTAELLDGADNLRLFINPGAGVGHLLPLFAERIVPLANGHGNAGFVAQHAVALLLALTNKIVPHHNWMAAGRWRTGDAEAKSVGLSGKTVGLVGYGAINRLVERRLSGFHVTCQAFRRKHPCGLAEFLSAMDVAIVAVPLTKETEGMIGSAGLDALGPDGLLVTVARGKVIQERALYEALRDGRIAGAAIDVWYDYEPEPDVEGRCFPYSLPFHELDNVVLSPHRAASPLDDLGRWDEVVENIRRVEAGRSDFLNMVDTARGY